MGLSKEYLLQQVARLEADIGNVPAPKELSVQIPYFAYLGAPPVPNPFTPERGKVYIFQFLMEDQVILLPHGVEPGFSFELWGVECNNVGPYRLEVVAQGAPQLVFGDCVFGSPPLGETNKFVIDGDGPSHEAVRLTFLGVLDYTLAGYGLFDFWKMDRLDDKSNVTKTVHYATAAALPAYTNDGHHADRVLTAVAPGQLTVDGKTYTSIDREKILVKDEGDDSVNGVYWLTQVDPWKLRRASIDQNDWQMNRRGALYQVWWGAANTAKQFFRKWYTSSIDPVAGGGGGGSLADYTHDDTLETTDTAWHTISTQAIADLKTAHVRATVWFQKGGTSSMCKWVMEASASRYSYVGLNINDLTYIYVHKDNSPGAWDSADADISVSGTDLIVRVKAPDTSTYRWRCQLEVSEHG